MAKKNKGADLLAGMDSGEVVCGVRLTKVDKYKLIEAMNLAGVKPANGEEYPEASLTVLVGSLAGWIEKASAERKENTLKCSDCGGYSIGFFSSCPFCGASDDDSPKPQPEQRLVKVDRKKKASTELAVAAPAALAAKDDLVASSALVTVRDLDAAVSEVHRLKGAFAEDCWDLGRKIGEIYDQKLWQLRVDAAGKAQFKNWEAFVLKELAMSHTEAAKSMDVSRAFSRAQMAAMGKSKLGIVLTVPIEDQPRLLEMAEKGAPKRELAEQAKEIKKAKKHKRERRDGKQATGHGTGRKPSTAAEKIIVAAASPRKTVKAYRKPEAALIRKGVDAKDLVRAKHIKDHPWCTYELVGGIEQSITLITDAEGQLSFLIETRRIED